MDVLPLLVMLCIAGLGCARRQSGMVQRKPLGSACETPNHEDGECIFLKDCPPLSVLINSTDTNTRKFLLRSQCGWARRMPKACCPTVAVVSRVATGTHGSVGNKHGAPPAKPAHALVDVNHHPAWELLPSPSKCGRAHGGPRIFGGNITDIGEYPWIVLLNYKDGSTGEKTPRCAGSLINQRYVITSAHCIDVHASVGKLWSVIVGEHNLNTDPDCLLSSGLCAASKQEFRIEDVATHPNYRVIQNYRLNDIAVLRLHRDVIFKGFLSGPICLPRGELVSKCYVGSRALVAGWGITETGFTSKVLLDVVVPVLPNTACMKLYDRPPSDDGEIGMVCAGAEKGKDSCRGDSGGPLMVANKLRKNRVLHNSLYLLGTVSFSRLRCGVRGWPSVYSSVPANLAWILDQIHA